MKVAIITPGFLPVPAIFGGAIENLIEEIINTNEIEKKLIIDLYTIKNEYLCEDIYKNTKIVQVKSNLSDKIQSIIYNRFHMFISKFNNEQVGNYVSPYSIRIKKLLKNKSYDYIIVENNLTVINVLSKRKNLIFHLHNDILGEDKPLYQCKKMINISSKIITVSNFMKNRLLSIDENANVQVLYNCIDFDIFSKKEVGEKSEFVFLYSGRLVQEKGVLELIKAFKKIENQFNNIKLVIIGKSVFGNELSLSEYEEKIKSEAESIKEKVIFTGFIEHKNIPDYLSKCHCVVIPTICEEAFGVVALEAMAMGKAIISTNSGGLTEIIDKKCGILVERDNIVENLYLAMKKIIQDKNLRLEFEKNGKEKVCSIKEFDRKNYYNNFLINLYDNINK